MDKNQLLFSDMLASFDRVGTDEWVTVYQYEDRSDTMIAWYSALLSMKAEKLALKSTDWDLTIGDGTPGITHWGTRRWAYVRFSDEGVEPIVFRRNYHGMRPPHFELSEEFRLYFNLFEDRSSNQMILIDDDGDEEVVVRISETHVEIKLRLLKEYISTRRMTLALFFDIDRMSDKTLEELGMEPYDKTVLEADHVYTVSLRNFDWSTKGQKVLAQLHGKKLVHAIPKFRPASMSDRKKEQYVSFIIGVDRNGHEIEHACDEAGLANYFGKNKGAPQYLTPVIFRPEVLTKYYSRPDKYSVEDGYLRCGGLWGLRMDNNQADVVMVYLGDLGKLSYKEQLHWRHFNILGTGKLSHIAWMRNFEAVATDPERSDLYFKQRLTAFNTEWYKMFKWHLFLPLRNADAHHLTALHIPVANEQKEFDEQVLSLTKLFIDSLNEAELCKGLELKPDAKGIDKLAAYLKARHLSFKDMIEFLRNLQGLRSSGVAHRKGDRYEKACENFGIGKRDLREVFHEILVQCITTLNTLQTHVLRRNDSTST